MKFGQLIEYNWETFFLKNHIKYVVEKLVTDPFLKNQNWVYFWINSLKFFTVCFTFPTWGYRGLLLPNTKLFLKQKGGLELVSLPHFFSDFLKKIFLALHSMTLTNCFLGFTSWDFEKLYWNCLSHGW